jgi:hypothetical protein
MPTQRPTGGGGQSSGLAQIPARTFVLIFIVHSFLVCHAGYVAILTALCRLNFF